MSNTILADEVYDEFISKPESLHIATRFALRELSKLVSDIKPSRVLEIGAGIGTITSLLLRHEHRPLRLVVTESHPVCLRELAKNIGGLDTSGYQLIRSPSELDRSEQFDLVIFDGSLKDDVQFNVFQAGTWCFVEGTRLPTRMTLNRQLNKNGLEIEFTEKMPGGYKFKWKGRYRMWGKTFSLPKIVPNKRCSIGVAKKLK